MIKHATLLLILLTLAATARLPAADQPAAPAPSLPPGITVFPAIPFLPILPQFTTHLSRKADGPAMTAFSNANQKIYLMFRGRPMVRGDKIRALWFIEDGGRTIIKNTKACESTLNAVVPVTEGVSYIVEPAQGWPVGAYRVDVYVNDTPITSMRFSVAERAAVSNHGPAKALAWRFWQSQTRLQASR